MDGECAVSITYRTQLGTSLQICNSHSLAKGQAPELHIQQVHVEACVVLSEVLRNHLNSVESLKQAGQ